MRKIISFLICLVTVYLVVFSKPISALSIIDDSDYYLGSNVSMEQELKVTIKDGADTYVVSINVDIQDTENVDIQDTEFSNKFVPVLAYLLLVFLLCVTLTFMGYGKCV